MIYYDLILLVPFLSVVFCLLSYLKTETFVNPASVISVWWGCILTLSLFNLIDLNYPRRSTYYLLIISFTLLNLGILTFIKRGIAKKVVFPIQKGVAIKVYFLGQIVLFLILLIFAKKAFGMLLRLDPNLYRYLVYDDSGIFGTNKGLVAMFIRPMIYSGLVLGISGLYLKNIPKSLGLLCLVNNVVYAIIIVGRYNFIFIFFSLFFGFFYGNRVFKIKLTKKIVLILCAPIVLILAMSLFRSSKDSKGISAILEKYAIWYTTGQFSALDYFLNNYNHGVEYSFTYIASLYGGIEDAIFPFIRRLSPNIEPYNQAIFKITKDFRPIGNGTAHNSMYTMLINFYRDGALMAVIVYSYLWGVVNALVYNYHLKKPSLFSFSFLLLITYTLIMCVIRWEPMLSWFWNSLFVLILVTLLPNVMKRNSITS